MIGLVLVTHGRLAVEFVEALEHVVGPQENVTAICIGPEDDMEQRRQDILDAVEAADEGDGVVLLTDMFGGTPSNLALGAISGPDIEVICGANLPLLVKLAKMRDRPIAQAVKAALESGHKYIDSAASILDPTRGR